MEVVFIIHNYINLTNGVEAIPMLEFWNEDYRFIRIQSTICEQKNWDRLIQDLDYDFLMNLALGHKCICMILEQESQFLEQYIKD